MQSRDWTNAWQLAAELGHYVADSHQALHLTLNYNGQKTDNYGIHSRYETEMINRHLAEINLKDSTATYWDSPIDSIFSYIEDIYPIVDQVMAADDRAYAADPNHGNTYYGILWEDLGDTTVWSLKRASMDLAALWYTAWMNAGKPYPEGVVSIADMGQPESFQLTAYPNPFNSQITLKVQLPEAGGFKVSILNLQGNLVNTLTSEEGIAGIYSFTWDGTDQYNIPVSSGVYFGQVISAGYSSIQKLILLK